MSPRKIATPPLFNIDRLRGLQEGHTVYLCEGARDAIALEAKGLVAIGVMRSALFRADWVDQFLKFKVVVLVDHDAVGEKFAKDIAKLFMVRGMPVAVRSGAAILSEQL